MTVHTHQEAPSRSVIHAGKVHAAQDEARTALDLLRGTAESSRWGLIERAVVDAHYHDATAALTRLVKLALHVEDAEPGCDFCPAPHAYVPGAFTEPGQSSPDCDVCTRRATNSIHGSAL